MAQNFTSHFTHSNNEMIDKTISDFIWIQLFFIMIILLAVDKIGQDGVPCKSIEMH